MFAHRATRRVGRGVHRLLHGVAALAAVLILVALFGLWRLIQGPIALNWLAPYVEAGIARSGTGLRVTFSGLSLGIDHRTHQLDLLAANVRVARHDGSPVARFPELAASFSLNQMLRGRLEPTQFVVKRPVLHLVRDAGGVINAEIGPGAGAGPEFGLGAIDQLAAPSASGKPFGLLRRIEIRNATFVLDDRASGRTWHADRVDLAVIRDKKGVRGDLSLTVPLSGSLPKLHASFRYVADRRMLDLDMSFAGIEPARIPPLIPELVQLQQVDAPVSGTLRTSIDLKNLAAQGSRLDLALGPGRVRSPLLPGGGVAIDKGELDAVYAPENETVSLDRLALDLGGGARLELKGTLSNVNPALVAGRASGPLEGMFDATLTHVPVARFASLWPLAMSPGGRRWALANVRDGVLDEGALRLALDIDPAAWTTKLRKATGTLRYHDLTINYLDGLPPARHVDGTAIFAGDELDFTPTAGSLKRLRVTSGTLRITDIGHKTEWLTIDLDAAGPLRDALDVIDRKPLGYARKIGIDPSQVAGNTRTHLHFRLPLLAALKLDQIDYGAEATITGADLGNVVMGRALRDGDFALRLGHDGADLRGDARFDGVPARLNAKVYFHPGDGPREVYQVGLTLDDAARRRLALDLAPDRVRGPIAAEVRYASFAGGRSRATARLDLRDAGLTIPEAGWRKPVGQPGSATIVLDLEHEKIARIPDIAIRAAGLNGDFAVSLDPEGRGIERVAIRRLAIGRSDLAGTVTRLAAGGWRADIAGEQLDAGNLLKEAAEDTRHRGADAPPLTVDARFATVLLGKGHQLDAVDISLQRSGGIWNTGRIAGQFANGRRLTVRLGEHGADRLLVQSDDFGAALKLLDITNDVASGTATIEGHLSQTAAGLVLRAHLEARDYTLVHAPWMARVLALPSFTGLASLLSGTGLPFALLRGDFTYEGGRIAIQRALAFGEALGLTAKGWVDLDRDRLDLQGTVAPAYALNSIAGKVPIVGKLLGGGEQGLFAANLRLSGRAADPQVSVNPLSALAPGFLRQLFPAFPAFAPQ